MKPSKPIQMQNYSSWNSIYQTSEISIDLYNSIH